MTKRAKAIQGLTEILADLALNGTPIKLAIAGANDTMSIEEGKRRLHQYQINIQVHLVEIVEHNPEQAEALMADLGIKWKTPPV